MAKQLNVNLAVTANTQQARQQLQQLQQTLSQLMTNSANLKIGLDQTQLQQASKQLLELQAHLKQATNVDTGALDFTKLNNSIRNSGKTLTQYGQQLLALGPQGKQAFTQLAQSVAQSEIPMRRLSGVLGQFGTVLKNTIRWQLSSSLIHGFMGSIQQAYGYAQDLNKSLNNIQIVTGLSDNQMAKFAKTANTAAKALSTTTTKYTDAALIYYQQGIRNESEIKQRTDATIKMANVTGQSAEAVSNQMTAIWNNFADGSKNLEYYADVITALGAATASSSEEISQGLQKFAAVADTVGLSYENASAALATITATTRQSADTVGTGLRTLFSRLQSLSLGETLEDGVNLTKYSKALKTVGVDALDAQGQLRSMDDVLDDLGNKWSSLSKAQQVALAQTVGGVRQYTTLVALMDNFDFYKQNLDIAKTSEGTLARQQAIYEKSWEAAAKRVKASAESIYSSLIDDKFFTSLTSGFAKFLDILNNIIAGLGGMKGLLFGIGGLMTNVFNSQITQGIYSFGVGLKNLTRSQESQRADRANFINNAAGLMAGGVYNAKTDTVTNVPGGKAPFSLVDQYTSLLQHQAAFTNNAQYMSPHQKQIAQMALDAENKSYLNLQQKQAAQLRNNAIWYDREGALRAQAERSQNWDQGIFDRYEAGIHASTDLYNRRMDMINRLREGGTVSGISTDDITLLMNLGIDTKDIKNWNEDSLTSALDQAETKANRVIHQRQETFVQGMRRFNVSREDALSYADIYGLRGQSNFDVINGKRRATQDRQNAKEAASASSKGMRIASGVTSVSAGVMQATAASAQLESMVTAIQKMNDGSLSAKDGITQLISSTASLGMNGVMAFQSMQKAMTAFGVTSQAVSAGLSFGLTAILVLLPYIVQGIDSLYETNAEKIERLNQESEDATTRANEAKDAYNDLLSAKANHNELLDTLSTLTKGTIEFRDALLEANAAAQSIISGHNLVYGTDWKYDENGVIRFTEGTLDRITEQQLAQSERAAEADAIAKWRASGAQQRSKNIKNFKWANNNGDNGSLLRYYNWLTEGNFGTYQDFYNVEQQNADNGQGMNTLSSPEFMQTAAQSSGYTSIEQLANIYAGRIPGLQDNNLVGLLSNIANSDNVISVVENVAMSALADYLSTSDDVKRWEDNALKDIEQTLDDGNQAEVEALYKQYYGTDIVPENLQKDYKALKAAVEQQAIYQYTRDKYNALVSQYDTKETQRYKDYKKMSYAQVKALQEARKQREAAGEEISGAEKAVGDWVNQYADKTVETFRKQTASVLDHTAIEANNAVLADFISQGQLDYLERASTLSASFQSAFGDTIGGKVLLDLATTLRDKNTSLLTTLEDVDLSGGTLQSLINIKAAGKTHRTEISDLVSSIVSNTGEGALFQELYNSSEFADTLASLQDAFKSTGKIGADSILEAADSIDILNEFLVDSEVNAQGLADALEAIEAQDISADQLTSGLLKALSAAGGIEASIAQTMKYISDYQKDVDIEDIGKFYAGLGSDITGSVENGAWFNPVAMQSFETLFGAERRQQYQKDINKLLDDSDTTYQDVIDFIQANYKDEWDALEGLKEYGDLGPLLEYQIKNNQAISKWLSIDDEGNIDFATGFEEKFETQQAFIDYLVESAGLNEDLARSIANDMMARSTVNDAWTQGAAKEGIELLKATDGILSADTVRSFYNQYSEVLNGLKIDGTVINSWEDLANIIEASDKNVVDLGTDFNMAEKSAKELKEAYDASEGTGKWNEYFSKGVITTRQNNTLPDKIEKDADITAATKKLTDLGATADEAYSKLDEMRGTDFDQFTSQIKNADGEFETLSSNSTDYLKWLKDEGLPDTAASFAKFTQDMQDAADVQTEISKQADIMATALVQAFAKEGLEIHIQINGEDYKAITDQGGKITGLINQEGNITINFHDSIENASALNEALNSISNILTGLPNGENGKQIKIEVNVDDTTGKQKIDTLIKDQNGNNYTITYDPIVNDLKSEDINKEGTITYKVYFEDENGNKISSAELGINQNGEITTNNQVLYPQTTISSSRELPDYGQDDTSNPDYDPSRMRYKDQARDNGFRNFLAYEGTTYGPTSYEAWTRKTGSGQYYAADANAMSWYAKYAGFSSPEKMIHAFESQNHEKLVANPDMSADEYHQLVREWFAGIADLAQMQKDLEAETAKQTEKYDDSKAHTKESKKDKTTTLEVTSQTDEGVKVKATAVFDDLESDAVKSLDDGKLQIHGEISVEDPTHPGQTQQIEYDAVVNPDSHEIEELKVNVPDQEALINPDTGLLETLKVAIPKQLATVDAQVTQSSINSVAASIVLKVRAAVEQVAQAMGMNNAYLPGYAGGRHSNNDYQGIAETGELGPELWVHNGQPYLTGLHGRTKVYVSEGDQIFTANQTRKILQDNPGLQDIPGFADGRGTGYLRKPKSDANSNNVKTKDWDPERYHLITRQIKDLQREYDKLSKIKDNCYGTNKLEAIQRELDATNDLINAQKDLIQESEDYLKIDTDRLKKLLKPGEFQLDENGNLLNFEELQQKYKKLAETKKDEKAEEIWKALMQYEETLDKLHESQTGLQDLIYQQMELRLEAITIKVDMKVNFDEREIKLLDHYIKRIDDNIYHTAEVLALTGQKLEHINQKINDTKEGIAGLFKELSDSEGNLIRKEDGSAYTLDEWLALSDEERDALNMNDNFGKQLEEYMDSLLDYIEELEEFKTKGVEEFGEAFSELNDNVRSSIDLFDHYNQLLSNLKNITDLQGVKLSAELKSTINAINTAMFSNTQNNIKAEQDNYKRLRGAVTDLQNKIASTQDETLKKQWEEQLKTAEEELRTSESNLLSLWETGLQQAKDMFETALDQAVEDYESAIAGMYGTVDELQKAYDQQKRNNEFYVKDFEKYYQISKLQRSITKDLAEQQKNGFKQSEGLKKLYDELNAARDEGVELNAYDLDIYAKRYEYEKAIADLEDSRNAKQQVRLQRNANGTWGYVYTNNADEDEIIAKQQAVDDKLYELQKATQERIANINDEMVSEITGVGARLRELRSSGASQETIDKYLQQEKIYLENYRKGLNRALEDAGMTVEDARLRYGAQGFDILDEFQESLLSAITGDGDLDYFFDKVLNSMTSASGAMAQAGAQYNDNLSTINNFFKESGEDLSTVIHGFASVISSESEGTLIDSQTQIKNAKDTFTEILKLATAFEKEFMEKYQPIIDANEKLVADLLDALHKLNSEEYASEEESTSGGSGDSGSSGGSGDSGGSGGSDGSGGSGGSGGSDDSGGSGGSKKRYSKWYSDAKEHWRYLIDENGKKHERGRGKHDWKLLQTLPSVDVYRCSICDRTKTVNKYDNKDPDEKTTFASSGGPGGNRVMEKMDTGGYTGVWGPEGKLAILHEKEQIFNKDDTTKILNAVQILRTLDIQTGLLSQGLGRLVLPTMGGLGNSILDQNVTITASFPNATNHSEIEEAFTNLINKASQYANRKNL